MVHISTAEKWGFAPVRGFAKLSEPLEQECTSGKMGVAPRLGVERSRREKPCVNQRLENHAGRRCDRGPFTAPSVQDYDKNEHTIRNPSRG